ncbi:MAG: hypothetical protein LBF54_00535 [Holosporaceae bacterium]|nr:hypothetical protein [Holosporaceae bacterium]
MQVDVFHFLLKLLEYYDRKLEYERKMKNFCVGYNALILCVCSTLSMETSLAMRPTLSSIRAGIMSTKIKRNAKPADIATDVAKIVTEAKLRHTVDDLRYFMFELAVQLCDRHMPSIPPDAVADAVMQIADGVGLPLDPGNLSRIFKLVIRLYNRHIQGDIQSDVAAAAVMRIAEITKIKINSGQMFDIAIQLYERHLPQGVIPPEAVAAAVNQIATIVKFKPQDPSIIADAITEIQEKIITDCTATSEAFKAAVFKRQFLFRPALSSTSAQITFKSKQVSILLIRDFLSLAYHKDLQALADDISTINFSKVLESGETQTNILSAQSAYRKKKQLKQDLGNEIKELICAAYAVPFGQSPDLDTVLKRTDEFVLRFSPDNVLRRVSEFNRSQLEAKNAYVFLLVFDQYWDRPEMSHMFRLHVEYPGFNLGKHESRFVFASPIDLGVDSQLIFTSLLITESVLNFEPSHLIGGLSIDKNPFDKLPVYCIVDDRLTLSDVTLKKDRGTVKHPFVEFQTFPLSMLLFKSDASCFG